MNKPPFLIDSGPDLLPFHDTLDALLDHAEGMARFLMGKHGTCWPIWIVCGQDNGWATIGCEWDDDDAKAVIIDTMRRLLPAYDRYALISEVWVSSHGSRPAGMKPSEDPNRGERLMITAGDRNGVSKQHLFYIERHGTSATLVQDHATWVRRDGGQLANLFTPKPDH